MTNHKTIFWHRKQQELKTEKILDEEILIFLYKNSFGRLLTDLFFSKKIFSKIYAFYYDSKRSSKKIKPFIQKFGIIEEDFEPGQYRTFNDFFIRKFKPGLRCFDRRRFSMPAFAEARYMAWEEKSPDQKLPVKRRYQTSQVLLDSENKANAFIGGPVVIARLAPQDYHRFHFVDSGKLVDCYRIEAEVLANRHFFLGFLRIFCRFIAPHKV